LRFSPSIIAPNIIQARLELIQNELKQYVVHRNVSVDPRLLVGCAPTKSGQAGSSDALVRDCDVCPELIVVDAGTFQMGSAESDSDLVEDEGPRTMRRVESVAISRREITSGEFKKFIAETGHLPSAMAGSAASWCGAPEAKGRITKSRTRNHAAPGFTQDESHPVVCVSWHDAKAYAAWLAAKSGKSYRLLSEAEHEYITRAGTQGAYWWGNEPNPGKAQYEREDGRTTLGPIGTIATSALDPNPWGFYHVSGNVAEWVEDCWNARHDQGATTGAARLAGHCASRVIRGGGWTYSAPDLRSAARDHAGSEETFVDVGFRVARDLDR
jgi:formylglycine-generating enzyme required for sulfatase activity